MNLIYGVKDRPKTGRLILFALQQLLAILAATITVPMVVNANTGSDMSISAALFGAGAGSAAGNDFTFFGNKSFKLCHVLIIDFLYFFGTERANLFLGSASELFGLIVRIDVFVDIFLIHFKLPHKNFSERQVVRIDGLQFADLFVLTGRPVYGPCGRRTVGAFG